MSLVCPSLRDEREGSRLVPVLEADVNTRSRPLWTIDGWLDRIPIPVR
jgi:hypothetical protein